MSMPISADLIGQMNKDSEPERNASFAALEERCARSGIDVQSVVQKVSALEVAIPTWGVGTGGTRFGRFPGLGEPRNVFEKVEDCAVIQQLVRLTPRVSPHFPWDHVDDPSELKDFASARGLGFDAVNSNTFQDQAGQKKSYKYGSLTHADPEVRVQAVAHNVECIELGRKLGADAITVWVGDGSNFPGQQDLTRALERYLSSMGEIYGALPSDWTLFIEHKMFEPAFYSTVIQDWGTSVLCAQQLGPQAKCLVDLGHHAPNVNIEMIVSRLHQFGKLGGFHFNDSKYGDDDLDTGAIAPFQLFLVFNELVEAELRDAEAFAPAYMMDQSHNVTDPIESLMNSADAIASAFAKALLVDREALRSYQEANDALMAHRTLKDAFETDVRPLVATARVNLGGAGDPLAVYRRSEYRQKVAGIRPPDMRSGGGIV